MVTRNGRIAVASCSAAAGSDESARKVVTARAMNPIPITPQISRSSGFMLFSRTHDTRPAARNLSDERIDDTFVLREAQLSVPLQGEADRYQGLIDDGASCGHAS